jgi:hypothetical protein
MNGRRHCSPTLPAAAPPACSFRLGRQEDAHEYLVALLDAIHECSIAGLNPKPAPELAQTSFVYRIFAGKIRSQVGAAEREPPCHCQQNPHSRVRKAAR